MRALSRYSGILAGLALLALLAGCAGHATRPEDALIATDPQRAAALKIAHLTQDLNALLAAPHPEAQRLARVAVRQTRALKRRYRVTTGAVVHNMLIHWGVKARGLCCHWTYDLLRALAAQQPQAFDLHWAVHHANQATEHSAVVITRKRSPLNTGIVLDGWRNAGRLFWAPVDADPDYRWAANRADGRWRDTRCRVR